MAKGDLAFVKLKSDVVEGDLMVGLGSVMSVEEGGKLMIHWFGRSQWLCPRSQQRWSWAATPFFKPLPHTQDTTEQLTDILPIIPTLTPSATLSKPRLTADCVRTIHALCVFRSLVHADDTRDAQGFGAESEGSEQKSEHRIRAGIRAGGTLRGQIRLLGARSRLPRARSRYLRARSPSPEKGMPT